MCYIDQTLSVLSLNIFINRRRTVSEAKNSTRISIRFKFFSVVVIFIVISCLIGIVGLWNLSGMRNQIKNIVDSSTEKIILADEISKDLLIVAGAEKNMLISEDETEMGNYGVLIKDAQKRIESKASQLSALAAPDEKKKLAQFKTSFSKFMDINKSVSELTLENTNFKAARLSAEDAEPLLARLDAQVEKILTSYEEEFKEATNLFDAMYTAEVGAVMGQSSRLLGSIREVQITAQAIILSREAGQINALIEKMNSQKDNVAKEFESLGSAINVKNKPDFEEAKSIYNQFLQTSEKVTELAALNSNFKAFELSKTEGRIQLTTAQDIMADLVKAGKKGLVHDRDISSKNYKHAFTILTAIALTGIIIGSILAFIIIQQVFSALQKSFIFAEKLSTGNFKTRLNTDRNDELGDLAGHLNRVAENVGDLVKNLSHGIEDLSNAFSTLTHLADQMSTEAKNASEKSTGVSASADEMKQSMNSVSTGMEETSANLNTVAIAAGELTTTINEVAQNTSRSRQITDEAVSYTDEAQEKVTQLNNAAGAIGKVTETITDISEQTNLLALNATIEAARAGEAGKGFAVVASEIKDLANQTSMATEDIKKQIREIQNDTKDTVQMISKVSKIVYDVKDLSSTIAAAIEEQSATTQEISNSIGTASEAGQEISDNISQTSIVAQEVASDVTQISQMSNELFENSAKVNENAHSLSAVAKKLREMAARFEI